LARTREEKFKWRERKGVREREGASQSYHQWKKKKKEEEAGPINGEPGRRGNSPSPPVDGKKKGRGERTKLGLR